MFGDPALNIYNYVKKSSCNLGTPEDNFEPLYDYVSSSAALMAQQPGVVTSATSWLLPNYSQAHG